MNKTKIEWADYTWNPVTGCLHGCPYCYARAVANRFGLEYATRLGDPGMEGACKYDSKEGMDTMLELVKPYEKDGRRQPYPMGFLPTFHRYKLDEPARKTKGVVIFVGSMTDLFGDWVPDEWIAAVFRACQEAPQHTYLFLTKNPGRLYELAEAGKLPAGDNFWYGSTATKPDGVFFADGLHHAFVSFEPILAPFSGASNKIEWAIFGAETGNRKDKVRPAWSWISKAVEELQKAGVPVFMKGSMEGIAPEMLQQTPDKIALTTKGAKKGGESHG